MNRHACWLVLLLLTATAFAVSPESSGWPQWQGVNRDAISTEHGLLQDWPKDGPPLAWQIKGLGGGYSAPSVAAGHLFGMSTRDNVETVWALAEADGKELWATPLKPAVSQSMPQGKEGPGCTPTVDGDNIYVIGNGGDVVCLHAADGKIVWQRNMAQDFGARAPNWSYRESPLIDAEKLICTPGGPGATLVALDKLTGKTIWKSAVPGNPGAGYASAIAIDFEGQRQYVQVTRKAVVGIAADDGKFLWQYDKPANKQGINCTTPIYHDGYIFAASAYGAGGGLIKLSKTPDGVKADEVYFTKKMQNHHGGIILDNEYLYGANGGNGGGALICLDFKTGNVAWDQRLDNKAPKGSIAEADGRLYYLTENGTVLLIEPNPKAYTEHGRFQHPTRSRLPDWSHPVIANGKLYLRDQDSLLCYDIKAK